MRWLALAVLVLIACEGPTGPAGPEGPPASSAREVYSGTITNATGTWVRIREGYDIDNVPLFACYQVQNQAVFPTENCALVEGGGGWGIEASPIREGDGYRIVVVY